VFDRAARIKTFPNWSYAHLLNLAANLATAFDRAHRLGLILGDVSSRNALCDASTYVKLIDLESAQISSGDLFLPCLVATTDYAAPELQTVADYSTFRRSAAQDSFGLAALVYQILSDGVHPYYGTVETPAGAKDLPPGIGERIVKNLWPHSSSKAGKPRVTPPPDACDFAAFPPELQNLFFRAFDEGHANPARRPAPSEFASALTAQLKVLSTCRTNPKHRYARELRACPWCERREALHIESFPCKPEAFR
jgi:DNA-binding helix-hairpin-helix protein with protein kinase domain